jgi:lysophospholipase L1-like esterase
VVSIFVGNDFYKSVLTGNPLDLRDPPPGPRSGPTSHLLTFLKLRASQSARAVGYALALSGALGISLYDTGGSYVFLRRPTPEQHQVFEQILDYLRRIKDVCDAHQRKLLVVIMPNRIQVENAAELTNATFDARLPDVKTLAYCLAHGIPCLDLLPALQQAHATSDAALYFPIDRHPTPVGAAVAARTIAPFLIEEEARARSPF